MASLYWNPQSPARNLIPKHLWPLGVSPIMPTVAHPIVCQHSTRTRCTSPDDDDNDRNGANGVGPCHDMPCRATLSANLTD